MKSYDMAEQRLVVTVRKSHGSFIVTIVEKGAPDKSEKYIEFTPSR